ncbi:uncharacterized protein LY79DRAFT_269884 [Colletotrichum navitas]|uniref:Uncharacterized protein n=1 Tax=Colletotrichum navitas TaxID=681940 RepID=A0AAD8PVM2_9PEZI|nr:uncharacterized protein LY79DRAFT_269884 [Colletotrichum navitas]KAK1585312.1 hypothetical protein LY79DRAFT_269884 [Colletotrichum navitas]
MTRKEREKKEEKRQQKRRSLSGGGPTPHALLLQPKDTPLSLLLFFNFLFLFYRILTWKQKKNTPPSLAATLYMVFDMILSVKRGEVFFMSPCHYELTFLLYCFLFLFFIFFITLSSGLGSTGSSGGSLRRLNKKVKFYYHFYHHASLYEKKKRVYQNRAVVFSPLSFSRPCRERGGGRGMRGTRHPDRNREPLGQPLGDGGVGTDDLQKRLDRSSRLLAL